MVGYVEGCRIKKKSSAFCRTQQEAAEKETEKETKRVLSQFSFFSVKYSSAKLQDT